MDTDKVWTLLNICRFVIDIDLYNIACKLLSRPHPVNEGGQNSGHKLSLEDYGAFRWLLNHSYALTISYSLSIPYNTVIWPWRKSFLDLISLVLLPRSSLCLTGWFMTESCVA